LGENQSGKHQIGECACHDKALVIGARIKNDVTVKTRMSQCTVFIADDRELKNVWPETTNTRDNCGTLWTIARSREGDDGIDPRQIAICVY
jgi:hypothetical protein